MSPLPAYTNCFLEIWHNDDESAMQAAIQKLRIGFTKLRFEVDLSEHAARDRIVALSVCFTQLISPSDRNSEVRDHPDLQRVAPATR
jgi:hypothetical protein